MPKAKSYKQTKQTCDFLTRHYAKAGHPAPLENDDVRSSDETPEACAAARDANAEIVLAGGCQRFL